MKTNLKDLLNGAAVTTDGRLKSFRSDHGTYKKAVECNAVYDTPSSLDILSDFGSSVSGYYDLCEVIDMFEQLLGSLDTYVGMVFEYGEDKVIFIEMTVMSKYFGEYEDKSNDELVNFALNLLEDNDFREGLFGPNTQAANGGLICMYQVDQ
ncbi:hypothetical protein [Vibrio owensii]|uniref:hypothetical protein n=1 Tax=Vibrio owensii TaxID=696485 RepID=UPI0018F1B84F|nr:hypothetical protein [Vibrio owensii]